LIAVDTSYLNKDGKKTANYNKATEEDAVPDTYIEKIEKYLLPAWERRVKLVVTNNWDNKVVSYLKGQGFRVLKSYRAGASIGEQAGGGAAELIAVNFDERTGKLINRRGSGVSNDAAGKTNQPTSTKRSGSTGQATPGAVVSTTEGKDQTLRGRGNGRSDSPSLKSVRGNPIKVASLEEEAFRAFDRRYSEIGNALSEAKTDAPLKHIERDSDRRGLLLEAQPVRIDTQKVGQFEGVKQLREKAREIYNSFLGKTVETTDGRRVGFTKTGIKETISHSADERVLYVIPELPELIKNAIPLWSESTTRANQPNIKALHNYGIKTEIKGELVLFVSLSEKIMTVIYITTTISHPKM